MTQDVGRPLVVAGPPHAGEPLPSAGFRARQALEGQRDDVGARAVDLAAPYLLGRHFGLVDGGRRLEVGCARDRVPEGSGAGSG
ncbi:hypothetical protein ABGB14_00990 [Nonomuraea sp. B10E15]|uniref:hypothetical protein n=1 Tax=unclassified Nonomuraea TaxID=2593643 RepID=UPI00325F31B5